MSKKNKNQSPSEPRDNKHDATTGASSSTKAGPQDKASFQPATDQSVTDESATGEAELNDTAKVKDLQEALKHAQDKVAYLAADFENFRRRNQQDSKRRITRERVHILSDLLAVIDDFERSFTEIEEHIPELTSRLAGFELIYKALKKVLSQHGVQEVAATGVFNPEIHEAVMQVDDPEVKSGHIVAVLQKGYLLQGELLRPAKVSVKP